MKFVPTLAVIAVVLAACGRSDKAPEKTQIYMTRGIVRGFSPDRGEIEIQHETIPDYMPSMTMPFRARSARDIADLKPGNAIAFRLTVTSDEFWIDQIRTVPREEVQIPERKPEAAAPAASESPRLREGDAMPVFSLTNQDGQSVTLDAFRGHPFILTFVFTRCPIPNFCPRMSGNFAELQSAIKKDARALAQTHLLSITLDPEFDTPAVLKAYGEHVSFDPHVWSFATGDAKQINALAEAFSIYRKFEGGSLSHGLATALVDRDGTIRKIWRGNAWLAQEVVDELKKLN